MGEGTMAVKGKGYLKTTWAFQERPVASSKLNTWDDRIEAALELTFALLNLAWGGGDGVVRGATVSDLQVEETEPPGLSVHVSPGYAFIAHCPFKLGATYETIAAPVPAANPRIDLVQARLETWDIALVVGTEASVPSAPSCAEDCIPLAHLYCRPGMTAIRSYDDATNGYIIDARQFL
ncbi:MAG: hypothetical protein GY851_07200 [bacterium]|nr:hypothetical protein [bacterium]